MSEEVTDNVAAPAATAEVKPEAPVEVEEQAPTEAPDKASPQTVKFKPNDGTEHDLSSADAYYLMNLGYESLSASKPSEPEKEEPAEDLTTDERLDKVNREFTEYREEQAGKERNQHTLSQLEGLVTKAEFLKENPEFTDTVKLNALVRQQAGDKRSLQAVFADELKRVQDVTKTVEQKILNKLKVNGKAWAKINNLPAAGGGMPQLQTEHKFTAADVKSGRSKGDLQAIIESIRAERE